MVFKKNPLNSFTANNTRKLEENDNKLKRRPEMLTKTNFDVTGNKRYDGDNNGRKNENFDGRGNF